MTSVLYVAIKKKHRTACEAERFIPLRLVSPVRRYIGLRRSKQHVLARASIRAHRKISMETHYLLKITFTVAGFAHYCSKAGGERDLFAPCLSKRIYSGREDLQVWHFLGVLPIVAGDSEGQSWIVTAWEDID